MGPAPDAAVLRRDLDEVLQSVLYLQSVPEHRLSEAEEPVWERFRQTARSCRSQPWLLDAAQEEQATAALRFLVSWASKRRVLRAKVVESLQIVLGSPQWLRAARSNAELLASLEALLPVPESVPTPRYHVDSHGAAAEGVLEAGLRQEVRGALESMSTGLQTLKKFEWTFPPESCQNTNRDAAIDAFRNVFLGASRLYLAAHRDGATPAEKHGIMAALEANTADWSGMLRFLVSLHKVRRVFASQISSLTSKLSDLSRTFDESVTEVKSELPPPRTYEQRVKKQGSQPVSKEEPISDNIQAERSVFVGTRVEALYKGQWYGGTVISVPAEDAEGRWVLQCDGDEPGMLTYAKSVSSRVEALYEGEWFSGSVVSVPSEDPESGGRWAVQCDSDPPGTLTYTHNVRLMPESAAPSPPRSPPPEPADAKDVKEGLTLPDVQEVKFSSDVEMFSAPSEVSTSNQNSPEKEAPSPSKEVVVVPTSEVPVSPAEVKVHSPAGVIEVSISPTSTAAVSTPVSPSPPVVIEGMPLKPAPMSPAPVGDRVSLGALAKLPGSVTPPRAMTQLPGCASPMLPGSVTPPRAVTPIRVYAPTSSPHTPHRSTTPSRRTIEVTPVMAGQPTLPCNSPCRVSPSVSPGASPGSSVAINVEVMPVPRTASSPSEAHCLSASCPTISPRRSAIHVPVSVTPAVPPPGVEVQHHTPRTLSSSARTLEIPVTVRPPVTTQVPAKVTVHPPVPLGSVGRLCA